MLKGNDKLISLLLHWNEIRVRGGAAIAKSLVENEVLEILDLSYNGIGGDERNKSAEAF